MDLSKVPSDVLQDEIWVMEHGANECIMPGECPDCPFHPDCLEAIDPAVGREERIARYVLEIQACLAERSRLSQSSEEVGSGT